MRRLLALALLLGLGACADKPSPLMPQLRPVSGGWVSDAFGARPVHPIKGVTPGGHHDGCDFAVATGSPIKAAQAGVVTYVGWLGGYGNTVVLKHAEGWSTLYGHAEAFKVKQGQVVKAGQLIALVGSTGLSTGPHLHYELRKNGVPVDPGNAFQDPAVRLASLDAPPPSVVRYRQVLASRGQRPAIKKAKVAKGLRAKH